MTIVIASRDNILHNIG